MDAEQHWTEADDYAGDTPQTELGDDCAPGEPSEREPSQNGQQDCTTTGELGVGLDAGGESGER